MFSRFLQFGELILVFSLFLHFSLAPTSLPLFSLPVTSSFNALTPALTGHPPIQVVAHLFSSHVPQAVPQRLGKSSSVTRLYKAHTVAAKFQQSLLDLVEKMERWVGTGGQRTQPHLKPTL